jgi:4-hydroxy-4-methyl-2-oxoglutarate aldolase
MTDENLLQRLRRLDVCAVSDALDQLKLPSAVTGIGPRTARRRIAGQVVTVRLAAGSAPPEATPRHLCTTAIEAAPVGGVVVVEQRTGLDASGWGGILSNAALTRALSGVIVEGPARDIDEAADLGFPVYARSQTARTARGRIHEAETGGEIQVGDVKVRNGDFVVADSSGVTFIPADQLEAVLAAAERIVQREAAMTKAVLTGAPVSQVMGGAYEHMLSNKD